MFTLNSKNSWFIHVLARNEKKICFTKIGKHDPMEKCEMVQHFSVGLGHASSQVSYMVVSKYHFLYVESNIEQMF